MQLAIEWFRRLPLRYLIDGSLGAAVAAGIWFLLRGRKRKSASERERDRRLAVNAIGRMTDGTLTEPFDPRDSPETPLLVFYRYFVAGVEYSAAQDLSNLRHIIPPTIYLPGETATTKYDQHNPSNSIVLCEQWSGLRAEGDPHLKGRVAPLFVRGTGS
jgi:hypothetical protein